VLEGSYRYFQLTGFQNQALLRELALLSDAPRFDFRQAGSRVDLAIKKIKEQRFA